MSKVRVRVMKNRLADFREDAVAKVAHELAVSAHAIEQDVKGLGPHAAPYRTGNLRRSYHVIQRGPLEWIVQNDAELAPYALYVELGARGRPPKPHLGPAAEAERPKLVERVKEALKGWR